MNIIEFFKKNKNVFSFIITFAFAIFNGIYGIFTGYIWSKFIFVYYVFLFLIRFLSEKIFKKIHKGPVYSSLLLLMLNLSLIAPITIMVLDKKSFSLGLIAAITIAAYTTYKITIAIINYKNKKIVYSPIERQYYTINLIDAILSVLTLQNTLILAVDNTVTDKMFTLVSITSFFAVIIMIFLSVKDIIYCYKTMT